MLPFWKATIYPIMGTSSIHVWALILCPLHYGKRTVDDKVSSRSYKESKLTITFHGQERSRCHGLPCQYKNGCPIFICKLSSTFWNSVIAIEFPILCVPEKSVPWQMVYTPIHHVTSSYHLPKKWVHLWWWLQKLTLTWNQFQNFL